MTGQTVPRRQPIPPRDIAAGAPVDAWLGLRAEFNHLKRPLGAIAGTVLVLLAAGVLFRQALLAYYHHLTLTGLTEDARPVKLTVAGEALTIPANVLRYASERRGGRTDRADLVLLWPGLEGYTREHADAFSDSAPAAPLIYATIAARSGSLDSTDRLDDVYERFFTGKPVPGPNGLVGRHLTPDSGYGGEIVFYAPRGAHPFVARCPADSPADIPTTCIRDVNIGRGLSLLYRFDRALLDQWQPLDRGMTGLAATFLGG